MPPKETRARVLTREEFRREVGGEQTLPRLEGWRQHQAHPDRKPLSGDSEAGRGSTSPDYLGAEQEDITYAPWVVIFPAPLLFIYFFFQEDKHFIILLLFPLVLYHSLLPHPLGE